MGAEAAAVFQKILDHRGIVLADPVGALAVRQGFRFAWGKARAKHAYQDFFTLWKQTDAGIPVLQPVEKE
jgi:eukaryotic-like serine/threonine-protein kinase